MQMDTIDTNPDDPPAGSAYDRLLSAIRDGTYRPGDRMREVEVAARLDLSRTPVREAFRRLEADGIIVHRPRSGAVVRVLDHGELVELYEMRIVLERTAAEMAARHAAAAEIDGMEALNAELARDGGDPSRAAALNQAFHRALYRATRNRFLIESARALNNALLLLGPTTLTDTDRRETVCRQHGAILTGLRAGDPGAAGAAAEAHLETSLRHRLGLLA